ncbi:MAG: alpha-mannosidase [Tannerella sp.]|jgi:alpha-mannosidase|nr:alpha-mannosidase [Tannerella sp.]
MKKIKFIFVLVAMAGVWSTGSYAQPAGRMQPYDLSKDRLLYAIGYSHLDTQWNWDYVRSIDELLKNIMTENFVLFEAYPDYVFNFTGSRRYRMMKEYYPDLYEKVKEYVAGGRWYISGSAVDEGEVIISSPESIIRQTLYGYKFFMNEFGTAGQDAIFPDIFGFPANLPTIWRHSGLIGFSTIKLMGNCAVGEPFHVGVWTGPDGSRLPSAFKPAHYVSHIPARFDTDEYWSGRLDYDKEQTGYAFDYRFYGVGDEGGAPLKNDVKHAVESLGNRPDSKFRLLLTSSDQMFKDLTPEIEASLPVYKGDLLLVEHSNGSSVSQGFMKRLNRKNENLAQAAEQAAAAAAVLAGSPYPAARLTDAWELVLGSQMHDILPGTSTPKAYEYSWNDEFIAANLFSSVLTGGISALSARLDTRAQGRSVLVYNPVATAREDVVTAEMTFNRAPESIQVFGPDGREVLSQITGRDGNRLKFIFLASIPSVGLAAYDVRPAEAVAAAKSTLAVTERSLENVYYKVTFADNGDIRSIYDKKLKRELLSAPARLEFQAEKPSEYPAWNMDWKDRQLPPAGFLNENASFRVVENGPLRVALEVTREGRNSRITQTVSLAAADAGRRVEVDNCIDWQSSGVCLKAAFPLTAVNEYATYSQGVGTIARNTNHPREFEVPHHNWFDLTDRSGKFGVSIMEDCKYTSDKPDDHTLRLTLMFTPETGGPNPQATQDFGIHYVKYAIAGHAGDWRQGETWRQAAFTDRPLMAFETSPHAGSLGKQLSLLSVSNRNTGVMAYKQAERGDGCIVRVNELSGSRQKGVKIAFPATVVDAWEVDGREERTGDVTFTGDGLTVDLPAYAIRSFAVKLAPAPTPEETQIPVTLAYNDDAVSFDDNRSDGRMDRTRGESFRDATYPAEEMPAGEYVCGGVRFRMGSYEDETNNVVACTGQEIALPAGGCNRLYLLAASNRETEAEFRIGDRRVSLHVGGWTGYVGQHYNRLYGPEWKLEGLTQPYVRKDEIAWFASHHHRGYPSENATYRYCYIYRYKLDVPPGATSLTLPDSDDIKIFAITALGSGRQHDDITPLQPLYDDFGNHPTFTLRK